MSACNCPEQGGRSSVTQQVAAAIERAQGRVGFQVEACEQVPGQSSTASPRRPSMSSDVISLSPQSSFCRSGHLRRSSRREVIAAAIELAQAGKLADLPHRGDVAAGAIHHQDALRLVARNASVVIQIEHSETELLEGGVCECNINTLVLIILLVLSKAAGREQQQSEGRDKAQHGRIRYSRRRRSRRRRHRNWRRPGFRRRP